MHYRQNSHHVIIFLHDCVPEMFATSYFVTYYIYVPGTFHWSYKMPVTYILFSVWMRLSIFFQLSIIQYMGLCVFSLPVSLVTIERIYTLSYYHHQIGSMNYYPLFRVRSWNNGMRCMSLYSHQTCWCDLMNNLIIMMSWNENIFHVTGSARGIHQSLMNSPHQGQWRWALMFSLICT